MHGGKSQAARERTLAAFRDGSLRVLVATDLASRGIHVDGISHVINFDLPVDAEAYVHRIGRTARAGASGKALSLCTVEERDTLKRIEKLIQRRLPVREAPQFAPMAPASKLQYQHGPANDNPSRDNPARGPSNDRSRTHQRGAQQARGVSFGRTRSPNSFRSN